MEIHTNKYFGMCLVVISSLTYGGCSTDRNMEAQLADDIWKTREKEIVRCFDSKPTDTIKAQSTRIDDDLFIVFFDPGSTQAIVFDVELNSGRGGSVVNSGYARLDKGDWMFTNGSEATAVFEPHGGLWTFERLIKAIEGASNLAPIRQFRSR